MKQLASITDFVENICCSRKLFLVSMGSYGFKWETDDGKELLLNMEDYLWAFNKVHN